MFNSEKSRAKKLAKHAARREWSRVSALLIEGAPLNGTFDGPLKGANALMYALHHGNIPMAKELLLHGADPNATDYRGSNAYFYLRPHEGAKDLLAKMRALGGAINTRNEHGMTAFAEAIGRNEDAAFLKLLQDAGAVLSNSDTYFYGTILHYAASRDADEGIRYLIAQGFDVNQVASRGQTALHLAANYGRGKAVRALLACGANTELRDDKMNTPADLAQKDDPGIASFIREYGKNARAAEMADAEWSLLGDDEIARVSDKAAIGYRLTEIFNFTNATYTLISRNTAEGQESVTQRSFDDMQGNAAMLSAAAQKLRDLGGHHVPDVVVRVPALMTRKPQAGG